MNKKNTVAGLLLSIFVGTALVATRVEYTFEDVYTAQASAKANALAEAAAKLMQFEGNYEVVSPKKAGIQVNPWNNFIVSPTNQMTKNPIILINEEWVSTLPENEQLFLAARSFAQIQEGLTPPIATIIPWLWIAFILSLMMFIYWALGLTKLAQQPRWVRALLAWVLITICNVAFLQKIQLHWIRYVCMKHDTFTNEKTIEKTGDRAAAISALNRIDTMIKEKAQQGEAFFAPHVNLFADYAHSLHTDKDAHAGCGCKH